MDLKFVLLVLVVNVVCTSARSDTLQTFDINGGSGSFQPTTAVIDDKDGNRVQPTVTEVTGHVVIRTATMPSFAAIDPSAIHEDNYVYLPFIANPSGNKMVVLRYTYNHVTPCPAYTGVSAPVQCNNYVMLYLVPVANSSVNMSSVDVMTTNIGAFNLSTATGDVNKDHIIAVSSPPAGFRLVLHDQGSEFKINSVMLTRYYCEFVTNSKRLPIVCVDTPATDQAPTITQCTCGDANSAPNTTRSTIEQQCVYDTSLKTALFARASKDLYAQCDCTGNYEYAQNAGGSRYCRELSCGDIPEVENTENTTVVSSATVGSEARYTCITGYEMAGESVIECLTNQQWSTPPQCNRIRCGNPLQIQNGARRVYGHYLNDRTKYQCHTGYIMVGNQFIQCQHDGHWSVPPECDVITCGVPPTPDNAALFSLAGVQFGKTATYRCLLGYITADPLHSACQLNGQWSHPPNCTSSQKVTEAQTTRSPPPTTTLMQQLISTNTIIWIGCGTMLLITIVIISGVICHRVRARSRKTREENFGPVSNALYQAGGEFTTDFSLKDGTTPEDPQSTDESRSTND